jgi:hypothetical protein
LLSRVSVTLSTFGLRTSSVSWLQCGLRVQVTLCPGVYSLITNGPDAVTLRVYVPPVSSAFGTGAVAGSAIR